jgi:benzoyl-CoA reductase/2-hydroxyglutaryl-CoA dehydratase subunit BcrC/BadD/HgdB
MKSREKVMETFGIRNFPVCLDARVVDLLSLKKTGKKIVGYVCNGFMPEELVWSCGAIPVGLNKGGDYNAVLKSMEFIPRFFDTFSRSQIGYWALEDPVYRLIDLFVVPCTDKNIASIADCWEIWTQIKTFKLGIPHNIDSEHAFKYYFEGLSLLKQELEQLTGNMIGMERLREEINMANRKRRLLRQISEIRKSRIPPVSGKEFVKINHAGFHADNSLHVNNLELFLKTLQNTKESRGPRILVIGSSMAEGDYKIYDILESLGSNVVIEDFSEGMQPYWREAETNCSDNRLMEFLADFYFRKRTPLPAFFRPATEERYAFIMNLVEEFKVDGIIWYSMLYREAYDIEGVYFSRKLRNEGIPFIKIVTEYNPGEYASLQTRIGAFIESLL